MLLQVFNLVWHLKDKDISKENDKRYFYEKIYSDLNLGYFFFLFGKTKIFRSKYIFDYILRYYFNLSIK